MKVITLNDENEIGKVIGDYFCTLLRENPAAVLGLATGASPIPTYQRMISRFNAGDVSFAKVRTFNLDEYCNLPATHPQSYRSFMHAQLFAQVDIAQNNTHFLDGNAMDEAAECSRFDALIEQLGGVDLQLLGIGRNGHIGFNEPADAFTQGSFKVQLAPSTLEANSGYFIDENMPTHAMTMGVGAILRAKEILLVATGAAKAEAVRAMIQGEITPQLPASALQNHPKVTIYLDPAAASLLK
ncbi:MAG: glucosamine-6-phosphate deaminase [Oscillospiraceae bacterium]|nr:glucosamine-6-phosphate deaminase [Oscillospiraceae bacterium]